MFGGRNVTSMSHFANLQRMVFDTLAAVFLAAVVVLPIVPGAAAAGRPMPKWGYTDTPLPVGWFGANRSGFENEKQLETIGNYSLSIFGWQASS